ncbi:MAG: hypothetical protein JJV98_00215, partial [Desulfosarcina sp.]|nr:hypothetical protein [Desulfobacterales bacterium]
MIVEKPRISEKGEDILVSAAITNRPSGVDMPETLWFRVSNQFRDGVTDRSDPFLVAMLPVAMALGKNLEIEGTVSSRLVFGLRDYQRILHAWWPEHFAVVNLKYAQTTNGVRTKWPKAVGSTFSGGVDSFYTLYQHRTTSEVLPEYRLTHCLMINGFDNDVDLEHTGLFQMLREVYEPMISAQGIKLVVMQTNLQQFRLAAMARGNLHLTFGMPLAAAAMVLGNMFARFYIPASYQYRHLVPDGSHPILDHLLSTETMQMIHDGASASRVAKTIAIAAWPDTHSRLRVCFRGARYNPGLSVFENCGTCEKCIRTMIPLEVTGLLSKFST